MSEVKSWDGLPEEAREFLKGVKDLEKTLLEKQEEFTQLVQKANGEAKEAGDVAVETKAAIDKVAEKMSEITDRLVELEQRDIKAVPTGDGEMNIGKDFLESDQFKALQSGSAQSAKMMFKTAIINATGQNQPLVPSDRDGTNIYTVPNRVLSIRDILPSTPTDSSLIEYTRENAFTNNAGAQVGGSPEAFENVTKPESAITFTLVNVPVQTIAHFIPASTQVLEDAPGLQAYINGRLMYGLKLKEETQLLLGDGANGELTGLHANATAYTVQSPNLTNEIDIFREVIKQAHVAEYQPDFAVMNPQDWYDVDVRKVGSSDDRYVVGNPREFGPPRLWGLPIVVTNSLTSGQLLIGSSAACMIRDRRQATVQISLEDSTNFQKNMATIRAEERIALTIFRTEAFLKATV